MFNFLELVKEGKTDVLANSANRSRRTPERPEHERLHETEVSINQPERNRTLPAFRSFLPLVGSTLFDAFNHTAFFGCQRVVNLFMLLDGFHCLFRESE